MPTVYKLIASNEASKVLNGNQLTNPDSCDVLLDQSRGTMIGRGVAGLNPDNFSLPTDQVQFSSKHCKLFFDEDVSARLRMALPSGRGRYLVSNFGVGSTFPTNLSHFHTCLQANVWMVEDMSTNGTFVKEDGKYMRIGKGNTRPLAVGGMLRLSQQLSRSASQVQAALEYELQSFEEGEVDGSGANALETVQGQAAAVPRTPLDSKRKVEEQLEDVETAGASGKAEGANGSTIRRGKAKRPKQAGEQPVGAQGAGASASHELQLQELIKLNAENEELRKKLNEERTRVATLEDEQAKIKAAAEEKVAGLEAQAKVAAENADNAAQEAAAVIAELNRSLEGLQSSVNEARMQKEAADAKAEDAVLEVAVRDTRIRQLMDRVEELEKDVLALRQRAETAEERLEDAERARVEAEAALKAKEASQAATKEELSRVGSEEAALRARYEAAAAEAAELRARLISRDAEVSELKRKSQALELSVQGARERESLTRVMLSSMQVLAQQASERAQSGARLMQQEVRAAADMAQKIQTMSEQAAALGGGLSQSPAEVAINSPGRDFRARLDAAAEQDQAGPSRRVEASPLAGTQAQGEVGEAEGTLPAGTLPEGTLPQGSPPTRAALLCAETQPAGFMGVMNLAGPLLGSRSPVPPSVGHQGGGSQPVQTQEPGEGDGEGGQPAAEAAPEAPIEDEQGTEGAQVLAEEEEDGEEEENDEGIEEGEEEHEGAAPSGGEVPAAKGHLGVEGQEQDDDDAVYVEDDNEGEDDGEDIEIEDLTGEIEEAMVEGGSDRQEEVVMLDEDGDEDMGEGDEGAGALSGGAGHADSGAFVPFGGGGP